MVFNQKNNFKEIADRVIQIKQMIENNYFLISSKIEKIMSSSSDKKLIDHCLHKQKVLDDGITQISALLEKIAARYYINIENEQNKKLKDKEKELLDKINNLEKEAQKKWDQNHDLINNAELDDGLGKDNFNEIKDLRKELDLINKSIENNEYELSGFDSIGFEDFSSSVRKIADENEVLKDKLVESSLKDEFFKQQNVDVVDTLTQVEKNLSDKIEQLKSDNALVWDANANLIWQLEQAKFGNANTNANQINTAAIEQLDVAINSMISKVENSNANTANLIDNFSKSLEVKNLETMTNAIVNSLEKNIETLTNEINDLKNENKLYKIENEEKQNLINSLKEDSIKKENELNNSYSAWIYNNKKLDDLQELLDKQSIELYELDGQKSTIINTLQDKLTLAQKELENLIKEKNDLLNYQNELLEYIEQNKNMFEFAYGVSDFDSDVHATSLKELVEKETSKVLDNKVGELLNRYRNELNEIEESLKQSFLKYQAPNDTKDLLTLEMQKFDNADLISSLESKVDIFDKKIKNLESEFRDYKTNKDKTLYALDDLNEALSANYQEYKNNLMDDEIKMKLDKFENNLSEKIEKTIDEKIKELNALVEDNEPDEYYLSDSDIEEIVTNSNLYNEIKSEVKLLQNQVEILKIENIKIKEENRNVNYQLDNSLNKFAYNNEKIREVENLVTHNIEELERLSNDKDEIISELERRLKMAENEDNKDDNKLTDEEIKKLIDQRVDELLASRTNNDEININFVPIENNEINENVDETIIVQPDNKINIEPIENNEPEVHIEEPLIDNSINENISFEVIEANEQEENNYQEDIPLENLDILPIEYDETNNFVNTETVGTQLEEDSSIPDFNPLDTLFENGNKINIPDNEKVIKIDNSENNIDEKLNEFRLEMNNQFNEFSDKLLNQIKQISNNFTNIENNQCNSQNSKTKEDYELLKNLKLKVVLTELEKVKKEIDLYENQELSDILDNIK